MEVKVIVSKERGTIVVFAEDDVIQYESLLEGEILVDLGNYNNCITPSYDGMDFIDLATDEEKAARSIPESRQTEKITLDGLDIDEVIDLLKWRGLKLFQ